MAKTERKKEKTMKRFLSVLTLSSALLLTACGNDTAEPAEDVVEDETEEVADDVTMDGLQEGSYRIEDANFDENGWKEALDIVVVDGEITEATWESVNEDGENKIEDDGYQEAMTNAVEVGPQDFIPALENDLVEKQDAAEVEVVSGATSTSDKFKDYAAQVIEAAEEGNTETIVVDNEE